MIGKNIYLKSCFLFFLILFLVNSSFAQNCGSLSLDSISNPGEYTYGSLTESNGIRNGPDYNGATIYYPTNAIPPFAGMAIVPGYVSPQSSIQSWGPFLASHGIVTMTIGTNSIFEYPEDRRDALLDALITLKEENTRSGSPLFGKIDINSLAVGGWSMGGGGAQLAAVMDTTIKAVMALCPWLESSQLTPADLNHSVPILFFSGENDVIAVPANNADIHYNYTPQSTSKMLFEVASGDHSVANNPNGGGGFVGKIAVSWLKNFLVGDHCYCPFVMDTPPTASKYLLNVDCLALVSVKDAIDAESINYNLFPNPTNGNLTIEVEHLVAGTNYQILSMAGAKIDAGVVLSKSSSIAIQNLAPGIYLLKLSTPENSTQTQFVVK